MRKHVKSPHVLRQLVPLLVLSLGVVALQFLRMTHLAPPPEYIWDNVYLWDWARNFSHGDFSNFVVDSHHQLRWGNWAFAAVLIQLFGDEVIFYYLATLIPSTVAILIFCYIAWRNIGTTAAVLFIIFWFFDALLFRATFQLLPSGAGLLPLSLLLLLCHQLVIRESASLVWQVCTAVVIFWLYGTKETHLAFVPAVFWLIYRTVGIRPMLFILACLAIGYLLETLMFSLIHPDFSWLGRIHAVADGGQHVMLMTEQEKYVGQQTRYFDSGITMRWVATSGVTPIVVFIGFICALLAQSTLNQSGTDDVLHRQQVLIRILAAMVFSFVFFTTFFVVSVNPIRLGHPLVPRYATLLMPIIYLLVIAYLTNQTRSANLATRLGFLAVIPFFIAPSIDRYAGYIPRNVFEISEGYNEFSQIMLERECIRAKQPSIVLNQLDMIPEKYRNVRIQRMAANDELMIHKEPWYIVRAQKDKKCLSMFTIHRNVTARY
ncbi:MAG: hypothetical protein AAF431_08710 [Pseudomonadota bacterium]